MKFSELVAIMEGRWKIVRLLGLPPLLHSVGPHFLMGRSSVNADRSANAGIVPGHDGLARVRDAVLQEGMVFAFAPMLASIGTASISAAR